MTESRKLAAILVTDIVGYSRLAGADEDRILARLRTLRSDLIEPTISVHRGRVVKGTGDGFIVEFRSVVDAVRCAIEAAARAYGAQRRTAARASHRVPCRHPSRRRGRRERRRPDGRRRQYRCASRRHRQARGDLPVGGRLPAGQGTSRSHGQRPWPDRAQEYRRTDPGLFARGRRRGPGQSRAERPRGRRESRRRRACRSWCCHSQVLAWTSSTSSLSTA